MEFKVNVLIGFVLLICVMVESNVIQNEIETEYDEDMEHWHRGVRIHTPTRECSMAGGQCVEISDCAENEQTNTKGLCGGDRHSGIECCYAVKEREAPCKQFGGECTSEICHSNFITRLANDCGGTDVCCIWT